jgi:phosphoribosylformylglycinamidine synthase PurS subunit
MAENKSYRVEVSYLDGVKDATGDIITRDIADIGVPGVEGVRKSAIYIISGELDLRAVEEICGKLLADPVVERYTIDEVESGKAVCGDREHKIDVFLKKGVTDTVGDSVRFGISDLGIKGVEGVKTGAGYCLKGNLSKENVYRVCQQLLANSVIHDYSIKK